VIPLLALEATRARLLELLEQDPQVLIWWGTTVEIASALARREREQLLSADEVSSAMALARQLTDSWHEIVPSDAVRRTAERLLRMHPLRRQSAAGSRFSCGRSRSGQPAPGVSRYTLE
jgi:hypothetical protein